LKFSDNSRVLFFSKNRRGGQMDKLHFSLNQKNHVGWLFTEAINA